MKFGGHNALGYRRIALHERLRGRVVLGLKYGKAKCPIKGLGGSSSEHKASLGRRLL